MGKLFLRWAAQDERVLRMPQEFSLGGGSLGCLLDLQVEMSDGQLDVCAWN